MLVVGVGKVQESPSGGCRPPTFSTLDLRLQTGDCQKQLVIVPLRGFYVKKSPHISTKPQLII